MDIKIGDNKEEQYIREELQSLKKAYDELKAADKIQGIEINLLSKKIDKLISALQVVTPSKNNEVKDSRNKIDFISRGDSNASEANMRTCHCKGNCQPSDIAENKSAVKNESLDSKGVFIDYPLFSKIINCLHITATDESKELIDQLIDLGKKSMEHINRLDKVKITPNLNENVLCYPVKNHPIEDDHEHEPKNKSKKQFPNLFDTVVENAAKDASKKICDIIDDIAKKKSASNDIDKKSASNIRTFDDDTIHHVHANEDNKQDMDKNTMDSIRKSSSLKEASDKAIHPVEKAKKRRVTLSEEELKELFNDVQNGLFLDELGLFGIPAETIKEWLKNKHKSKGVGTYKIGKSTDNDFRKNKNRSSVPHRHRPCFDFE